MNETSLAAQALGRIRTEKKSATSRDNVAKAREARGEPKPCNCGRLPHKSNCPVYQREYKAKSRNQENVSPP